MTFDAAIPDSIRPQVGISLVTGLPVYRATTAADAADVSRAVGNRPLGAQTWFGALADRDNNPANIVHLGDSKTEGRSSTVIGKRWQDRLRDILRTKFPTTGLTTGGPNYLPTQYVYGATSAWTASGGGASVLLGLGLRASSLTASGHTRTLTVTGTSVDIFYTKWLNGGTFSYAVDGGSAANVVTSKVGAEFDPGNLVRVTLGAAGSHTLVVSWVSGGTVYIEGAAVFNGDETKGIRTYDAGHNGFQTSHFADATYNHLRSVIAANPHLVTIGLGDNDWTNERTASAAAANIQSIIAQIRSGMTISPWFVIIGWPRPLANGVNHASSWDDYMAAYADIAAADSGVSFFDLGQRVRPAGASNALGLWNVDLQHPTDKGSAVVADALASFISPR